MKKSPLAPRNPLVAEALKRKAGAHQRTRKAQRRADRMELLARLIGISAGNTALLMVLAASASYIAVPAVLRYALPEANPSLYFGMSLGVTFPFNLILGIPLYLTSSPA